MARSIHRPNCESVGCGFTCRQRIHIRSACIGPVTDGVNAQRSIGACNSGIHAECGLQRVHISDGGHTTHRRGVFVQRSPCTSNGRRIVCTSNGHTDGFRGTTVQCIARQRNRVNRQRLYNSLPRLQHLSRIVVERVRPSPRCRVKCKATKTVRRQARVISSKTSNRIDVLDIKITTHRLHTIFGNVGRVGARNRRIVVCTVDAEFNRTRRTVITRHCENIHVGFGCCQVLNTVIAHEVFVLTSGIDGQRTQITGCANH